MKGYKLILGNSYSLRLLTPQKYKILNQKLNLKTIQNQNQKEKEKEMNILKNPISNKTSYTSFYPRALTLSSTQISSNDYNTQNKLSQCLLINNRYNDNLYHNVIPSIKNNNNNEKIKNSRNIFNKTINCFSYPKLQSKSENKKYNINLINTEELTAISSLLSSFKSNKNIKPKKKKNLFLKNFKVNSLLYYLNKNTKMKNKEIDNRYKPFLCHKDYLKYVSKSEKFIKSDELKMLNQDTKLIKTIFDYINNSFSKIRYYQAMINQKNMNEFLEKRKNEKNYYHNTERDINLSLDKFLQIKKLEFNKDKVKDKDKDILLSVKKKNKMTKI